MSLVARGSFESDDGSEIAWYEGGRADGPSIVFLSGLGGGVGVWDPLVSRLGTDFRLIGWDYRGLYNSGPARGAPTMDRHAEDLLGLLRHAKVDTPVLIGWSMGVQVALELHRTHPDLSRAHVFIHGTSRRPLDTAFDSDLGLTLGPPVLAALGLLGRRIETIGPWLAGAPGVARAFTWLCRGLDLMSPDIDVDAFRRMAIDWTRLDFAAYSEIFRVLAEHDASDVLPDVKAPTLLISGGRDPFTPAHLSDAMAEQMPDATVAHVKEATHFGLLETPEEIVEHVVDFLRKRLGVKPRRPARRRGNRRRPVPHLVVASDPREPTFPPR